MSRRAPVANTLLSFRQINQSSLKFDGLCVCQKRKGCLQFQAKKKGLIGLQDSCQDRLVLFNVHMYDEFHVPDVLIMLLHM